MKTYLFRFRLAGTGKKVVIKGQRCARSVEVKIDFPKLGRCTLNDNMRTIAQPIWIDAPAEFQIVFVFVHQRISMQQHIFSRSPSVRHVTCPKT